MAPAIGSVLAINGGSSSIKFTVYQAGTRLTPSLSGKLDRVGVGGTTLSWHTTDSSSGDGRMEVTTHEPLTDLVMDWLGRRQEFVSVKAVGHRVVHGLTRSEPVRVTPQIIAELRRAVPYAPEH